MCVRRDQCPEVLMVLEDGEAPQPCKTNGTEPLVCCYQISARNGDAITFVDVRPVGETAKTKCRQYSKYNERVVVSPLLMANAEDLINDECEFDKVELVVGGTLAEPKEFPHMAQIGYGEAHEVSWACGGSLISENFVLTAGHCLWRRNRGNASFVRLGVTNQSDTSQVQIQRVQRTFKFPRYVLVSHYNDVGLIRLEKNVEINSYVRPACIHHTPKILEHSKVIATGWGATAWAGDGSSQLLKVTLETFSHQRCNATYKRTFSGRLKSGILDDLMICAGSENDIKDTCQGDSGGPLQIYHEGDRDIRCMYDVVGITSFGIGCGLSTNIPGVYTRVSNYVQWIEDIVWPANETTLEPR
ncbi:clotting factor G beta subunit-like isoform X2 [Cylas formicarius]|nr:clotting factor G beta subunit-like isoform X2 [Cylas formicarius]